MVNSVSYWSEALFNFEGPFRSSEINALRGYSSAGRAPALQAGGQRFESVYLHHDHFCDHRAFGLNPAFSFILGL